MIALILAAAQGSTVPTGSVFAVPGGFVAVEARAPNIIRIAFAKRKNAFTEPSFAGLPSGHRLTDARPGTYSFETSKLSVKLDPRDGRVIFSDRKGKIILEESTRDLVPATVQGEKTFHVRQTWKAHPDESLYGLGQTQLGVTNIKGYDLDLWQRNTNVVVPVLVSSRGYGIFWDNPSFLRFGDLRRPEFIPADQALDANGKPGGFTGTYYAGRDFGKQIAVRQDAKIDFENPGSGDGIDPPPDNSARPRRDPALPRGDSSVRWEGSVLAKQGGRYQFRSYSNGGIRLWVDGQELVNHWRQSWLPEVDIAPVDFAAGTRHKIRLEWVKDQGAQTMIFRWKTPSASNDTSLWSEVGDRVDYTFVYGPNLDDVVAGTRKITGTATMLPRWAFGLWQSRQRYETQKQSLDVVDGFRTRKIPFDNIVQDWFYWKQDQWGSHEFDPVRFPDPVGWIKDIHDRNAHLMISVWGKFYPGTKNFDEMNARGFLYQPDLAEKRRDWVGFPFTFYDAFNPEARTLFWDQMDRQLFTKGVDAWWMDASEPDLLATPSLEGTRSHMLPTAAGTPSRVLDGYGLQNARGIFEGQMKAAPDQRAFLLTRSGYAGEHRYSTSTWSGDITSTWTAMAKQIPAGLGFSISGEPYWTMDTGGFSVPSRFGSRTPKPADLDEWRELNARWFEFATFVPLLRVHGEFPYREMWQFGGETSPAYAAMLKFDRLRYRLMPYIYSLAGDVVQKGATMMRPMAMDFPEDTKARDLVDQFMFGKSIMVSPITRYQARSRVVYLPKGTWYDFWTGSVAATGDALAPYDAIPLHVRAGSIIPFGPEQQYVGQKAADPITLYVYTGADADFSLYEDDGLTNGYQRGQWSRIPIHWSESKHTLSIGSRIGRLPGMLLQRTFRVVIVAPHHPVGFSFDPTAERSIAYSGQATQSTFR